jgi:hypothetical protein
VSDFELAAIGATSPESVIAKDMVKKAAIVGPILIVVFGLIWGLDGALSTAYGLALVVANFVLAAALPSYAARISPAFLMGAALFGYLIRLTLIFLAIWLVKDAAWVELLPLGITIIATHLGLLMWEMKYVSLSLAYPAHPPTAASKESTSK